jgi:type I restriction enzyme R subunit
LSIFIWAKVIYFYRYSVIFNAKTQRLSQKAQIFSQKNSVFCVFPLRPCVKKKEFRTFAICFTDEKMNEYSEDILIEQTAQDLFANKLSWDIMLAYNKESFGEGSVLGRLNKKEVVLKKIFIEKLKQFNPSLPEQAYFQAYEKLTEESATKSLPEINYEKYRLLRNGIPVDYIDEKGVLITNKTLKVFDFENTENNRFLCVRQLWIQGKSNRECRPDMIGFVNGIPLLFIELKAAHRKLESAYNDNFTDYKDVIPKLFYYNAFVLLSNGIESRIGSITGKYQHFHE